MPITWAAALALVHFLALLVPGMIWAGGISARVTANEQWRDEHKKESVHRTEFEKLDASAVKQDEFRQFSSRVLDALQRVEQKLDRAH